MSIALFGIAWGTTRLLSKLRQYGGKRYPKHRKLLRRGELIFSALAWIYAALRVIDLVAPSREIYLLGTLVVTLVIVIGGVIAVQELFRRFLRGIVQGSGSEPLADSGEIFICYRREDSAPYAGRIFEKLSDQFGAERVFMDIEGVPAGSDFLEVIRTKIQAAAAVIPVIGPRWLHAEDESGRKRLEQADDFVRLELRLALDLGRPIIPLLVGGASMPKSHELPDELKRFAQINAIPLSDRKFRAEMNEVIEALNGQSSRTRRSNAG